MGIRSLCAAAAVVVSVGQAEAATFTTKMYDLFVQYEGTAFYDVDLAPIKHDHYGFEDKDIEAGDTSLGLKSYIFGLPAIGTIFQFSLKIMHPDVPFHVPYYGNGGTTPVCQLGPWDCTSTDQTSLGPNGFSLAYDDDWWMSVQPEVGKSFDVWFSAKYSAVSTPHVTADGIHYYWYNDERSRFTVLAVSEPAPVPLPATAALLPLGIGALAAMRKRRRNAR